MCGDCCDVNNTNTPEASPTYSVSNLGAGFDLFAGNVIVGDNTDFTFRSLVAGTNISLATDATTLTVNSTVVPTNTVTNLGGGAQVLVDVLAGSVRGRTLVGQFGTAVNQSGNVINISSNTPANVGGGIQVYQGVSGSNNNFRTLVPAGNISISNDATQIYFSTPITNMIPYSGLSEVNTYSSGNPEFVSMLGFGGSNNTQTFQDTWGPTPNDLTETGFVGYCAPRSCTITKIKNYTQAASTYTQTPGEELQIYAFIARSKTPDRAFEVVWFESIITITGGYSVNDNWFNRFEPNVSIEENWTVFVGLLIQRTGTTGDTTALQFYNCWSIETQS